MKILKKILAGLVIVASVNIIATASEPEPANNDTSITQTEAAPDSAIAKLPRLLDLGSKYCIPCKKMAPILDSLKTVYEGKAEITFIDIKEDKDAAHDYKITLIPTQVFFDTAGQEVYRHIGFFPADSISWHLDKLSSEK